MANVKSQKALAIARNCAAFTEEYSTMAKVWTNLSRSNESSPSKLNESLNEVGNGGQKIKFVGKEREKEDDENLLGPVVVVQQREEKVSSDGGKGAGLCPLGFLADWPARKPPGFSLDPNGDDVRMARGLSLLGHFVHNQLLLLSHLLFLFLLGNPFFFFSRRRKFPGAEGDDLQDIEPLGQVVVPLEELLRQETSNFETERNHVRFLSFSNTWWLERTYSATLAGEAAQAATREFLRLSSK